MKNEPLIEINGTPHTVLLYENSDGIWIIRDEETGVTTQAESKETALIMLADAINTTHSQEQLQKSATKILDPSK